MNSTPQDFLRAPQAKFHSELANILFDVPPPPERAAAEARVTRELLALIERMPSAMLFRKAAFIDANFIGMVDEVARKEYTKLSGANRLAVAKALEAKCPAAISMMPCLGRDQDRLRQAARLGRVLAPQALQRLVASIKHFKANGDA